MISFSEVKVFFDSVDTQGFWVTTGGILLDQVMRRSKTRKAANLIYAVSHVASLLSVGLHNLAVWSDKVLGQNAEESVKAPELPK